MQRFFDIILSSLAIIILSPLMLLVCFILNFTGEREIIYKQERIGKDGKTFNLLKFATMLRDSPQIGTGTLTIKNDPRILPFGKFLRRSKINELPQLVNVFFGSMSIIGPRPMTSQMFNHYDEEIKMTIKKVRPGLSGIGSVIFRNEEDLLINKDNFEQYYRDNIARYKGEVEKWYIDNNSILVYWKLIILTILVMNMSTSDLVWKFFPKLPKGAQILFRNE